MAASRNTAPAAVELHPLGFIVSLGGRPWPKTLPDRLCVFHSRTHARQFAAALDADDTEQAHQIIGSYGRWYAVEKREAGCSRS